MLLKLKCVFIYPKAGDRAVVPLADPKPGFSLFFVVPVPIRTDRDVCYGTEVASINDNKKK